MMNCSFLYTDANIQEISSIDSHGVKMRTITMMDMVRGQVMQTRINYKEQEMIITRGDDQQDRMTGSIQFDSPSENVWQVCREM